ncbi:MAG: hypothetical protein WAX14_17435 [Rhodococcus sp. (in: high G+C Gram-positive bacteria)]|uniref:restriction system modified-DNA reader domain-containing protein n=1 Tax=Rhodococcus sp. TaxID=1831 RepID=UPI003BB7CD13
MYNADGAMPGAESLTVQVHLPGGDPHGVRVVNRAGWDGYLLVVPRSCIDAVTGFGEYMTQIGTVVLSGPCPAGRVHVRIAHADPAAAQLAVFRAGRHWTHMYVLGRGRGYSRAVSSQVAVRLIETARSGGAVDVIDAPPQPAKPVLDSVRDDADSYTAEILVFLTLSGLDITAATERADTGIRQEHVDTSPAADPEPASIAHRSAAPAAPAITHGPTPQPSRGNLTQSPVAGKTHYDEDMYLLLRLRYLTAGQQLRFTQRRKGLVHTATVESDGSLRFQGRRYSSPSSAAGAASGTSTNGWIAWHTTDGRVLDDLRRTARAGNGRP